MKVSMVVLAGLSLLAAPAFGGDAAAGKARAVVCASCHGQAGISNNDLWPNLAGQKAAYLKKAMTDYREGRRTDPLMTPMAKPLSDTDIDNLAAYFSQL